MIDLLNLTFCWERLIIALLFTVIPFWWLKKQNLLLLKFYFIGIVSLIFVYSGVGSAWDSAPAEYLIRYCIYMLVLGLVCNVSIGKNLEKKYIGYREERYTLTIESVIKRYGGYFIFLYVFIPLLQLLLSGKFMNIFNPPSLSLTDAIDGRFDGNKEQSFIESLLYYIHQLLLPFYIVCLYKYRRDIKKLSIALLLPLYFGFASSGYIARSTLLPFLIMIYVAYYQSHPKYRKKILIGTLVGLPTVLFLLSWYTFVRQGTDFYLSFWDAIALLIKQETNYPIHYAEMKNWPFNGNLLLSYINWIITLPLPGFFKSTSFDYSFTAIFSEKMLGMVRTSDGFNILLPGLVGESIFIFGKYFFWVHAILVGKVISIAYKLVHHKQEFFLVLYMTIFSGLSLSRAGTVSILPFYFKHLIIYILVIYFMNRSKRKNGYKVSAQPII